MQGLRIAFTRLALASARCRRPLGTAAQPVAASAPTTTGTTGVRSEGDVSSVRSNTPRVYFVCHEENEQVCDHFRGVDIIVQCQISL